MQMQNTIACLLALAAACACAAGTAAAQGNVTVKSSKTCTGDRGRPAKADATWCRGGELHACNGKNGQWVNTRQKCSGSPGH
jgi:hypothetical protein